MANSQDDSLEGTIEGGARVIITLSREMFRDNQPCTDGDFVSVADKGKLKIKRYKQLPLKFRRRKFILLYVKQSHVRTQLTIQPNPSYHV